MVKVLKRKDIKKKHYKKNPKKLKVIKGPNKEEDKNPWQHKKLQNCQNTQITFKSEKSEKLKNIAKKLKKKCIKCVKQKMSKKTTTKNKEISIKIINSQNLKHPV